MRTLTFYSYKGGVGRSLLLANVAYGLARLGKRVLCLDLDLEAPGLHYKLLTTEAGAAFSGRSRGVVHLLASILDGHGSDSPSLGAVNLDDLVLHVADGVDLIPAGPIGEVQGDYWTEMAGLTGARPAADGLMRALVQIQAAILESGRWDYLLVDARTGITDVGAVATRVLAGTVLLCTLATEECLAGTAQVLEALGTGPAPVLEDRRDTYVVATRVPLPDPQHPADTAIAGAPDVDAVLHAVSSRLELRGAASGPLDRSVARGNLDPKFFVIRQDTALQVDERIVLADLLGGGIALDYARVVRALEPSADFSPVVDPLVDYLAEMSPDYAKRSIEAVAEVAVTPLVAQEWTYRILQHEGLGQGLSLPLAVVAGLWFDLDPGHGDLVRDLLRSIAPARQVKTGDAVAETLRTVARLLPDLIEPDGTPTTRMVDIWRRLVAPEPWTLAASIARLITPYDVDQAESLLDAAGDDPIAALVRAELASQRGDHAQEFEALLEALRNGVNADARRSTGITRRLATLAADERDPGLARRLLSEPEFVHGVAPDQAAAVAYLAGDSDRAAIWLARALGSLQQEPNSVRASKVFDALRRVGGERIVQEVVEALTGGRL